MTVLAVQAKPRIKTSQVNRVVGNKEHIHMIDEIDGWGKSFQDFIDSSHPMLKVDDYTIRPTETALVVMRDRFKCSACHTLATHFAIHKNGTSYRKSCNITFFHYDPNHGIIAHTKDHIMPSALGGVDEMENYQNMCYLCNQRKGHDYDEHEKEKYSLFEAKKEYVSNTDFGMTIHYHERFSEPFVYKKRKLSLSKDECIRIHRGKIIERNGLSFLDVSRLQQLAITEKHFFMVNQMFNNLDTLIELPWYLKPFKKVINKAIKSVREKKKISFYVDQHADYQKIIDDRSSS